MIEPKYKLGDKVIWNGDEGVVDAIKYTNDLKHPCYPYWYKIDLGYTWVGASENQLEKAGEDDG